MGLDRASTARVYEIVPERETITLHVMTGEGVYTDYTVAEAKLEPQSANYTNGRYQSADSGPWVLWRAPLDDAGVPDSSPKLGDKIEQADGTVWEVMAVRESLFGNQQSCTCNKLKPR